jgi:mRNA-degrading endonuclease toxin of MazEF toxin-antitoxin module
MKTTDKFSFGDIVSATMPFSDSSAGKIRPVLILTKDQDDYVFLKITTNISRKGAFDREIIPDEENGLRAISLIKMMKISTYTQEILHKKIGTLSTTDKQKIKKALQDFIDSLR